MRRSISLILIAVMLACLFAGCGETVNEIADSVKKAAMEELEAQVKATLEEHKLEVIELKTGFGKLNDDGGELQFFCAALIRTDSTAIAQGCVDALNKVFTDAGLLSQTGSKIESTHLVHKELTYKRTDFSDGTYYTVYGYHADLASILPTEGK